MKLLVFCSPPPVATGGAWSTRPGRGGRQWVSIGGRQSCVGNHAGQGLAVMPCAGWPTACTPNGPLSTRGYQTGATPSGVGGSELKSPCDSSLQGRRRGGRPPELPSQPRRAVPGFGSGGPPPGVEGDPARGTEAGNPDHGSGPPGASSWPSKKKIKKNV